MKSWIALVFCCVLAGCTERFIDPLEEQGQQGGAPNDAPSGSRDDERVANPSLPSHRGDDDVDQVQLPAHRPDSGGQTAPVGPEDAGIVVMDPPIIEDASTQPEECEFEVQGEPVTLTVPTDYATIQAAIDAARPLDTVHVLPGTYDENLRLKSGVRLVGSGAESTILDGGGRSTSLIDFTDAHDVVVSDFTLRNVGQGVGCGQPDDVLVCSGNWYASAVYADGHSFWGDSDPCNDPSILLSDNVITGNYVGVMVYFWPFADVRNNVFVGNRVGFAATAHGGATALVAHNVFVDNDEAMAVSASFLDIIDNVFVDNGSVLRQEACQEGKLRCNIVWSNDSLGDRLLVGVDDNLEVDPLLEIAGPASYGFAPGSPAIDRACAADTVPVWYDFCGP
jgi:hypothetical protein